MEFPNSAWVVLSGFFGYFIYRIGGQLRDALTFGTDALVDRVVRAIKLPIAGRSTVRRYCRAQLQGPSRYLAAASTVTRLLPTDEVYVPVATRGVEKSEALELTAGDSLPMRLVLVGPPGSGKTTVCKYLFRQACKALIDRASSSPLPVYLPLDRLGLEEIPATDPGAWLLARLASAIEASGLYRAEECFQIYLNKPGVAVFLDGLDELPPAQHRTLALALVDLDSRLRALSERSRILVTLRPSALASLVAVTGRQFEVYRLEPLTSETIFRFLQRWPSADPLFGHALFERLAGTPDLLEVCSSPLALAMYAAHAERDAGGTTFRSRTELYRAITDELLVRRAELVELHLPETDTVERRRRFLGRLAGVHLADIGAPANSIHAPTLLSAARDTLGLEGREAVAEVEAIARETGLLELLGRHQGARFIHLSFLEFFAADEAARTEDGWARLLELRSRLVAEHGAEAGGRLTEVCVFLAGLADPAPAGLLAALAQADGPEVALRAFIEAREYGIEAFPRLVQAEMEILFAEPSLLTADRWTGAALRVHAALEDARRQGPENAAARQLHAGFAAQVSRLSPVRRRFLLEQLARTDAVSACQFAGDLGIDVFTELPDLVLDNLDQPRFMSWLLARLDRNVDGHEVALLAEGALRNPFARRQVSASLPPPVCQGDSAEYAWAGRIGLPDNTYTRLVSLAGSAEGRRFASDDTPGVRLVFSVPAPAWQRLVPDLRTVAKMSAGLVLGLSILVSDERRTVGWFVAQTLLMGLAPLAIVLARGALVRLCYWKVLFSERDGGYQPTAPDLAGGTRRSPVSRWVANAFGRNVLDLSRAVGSIPRELDAAVAGMQELVAATEGFGPPRVRAADASGYAPVIPAPRPAAAPHHVRPVPAPRPRPAARGGAVRRLGRVPAGWTPERASQPWFASASRSEASSAGAEGPGALEERFPAWDSIERLVARRRLLVVSVFLAGWLVLIRSFQVSVVEHDRWATLRNEQAFSRRTEPAHRGALLDRHGRVLAHTIPAVEVAVAPYELDDRRHAIQVLTGLGVTPEHARHHTAPRRRWSVLGRRYSPDVRRRVEGVRGIHTRSVTLRKYPVPGLIPFLVDHDGPEVALDSVLRGRDGLQLVLRTASARVLGVNQLSNAVAGRDVRLSVDAEIQQTAMAAADALVRGLGADCGQVVVIDPASGGMLANGWARDSLASGLYPCRVRPGALMRPLITSAALLEGRGAGQAVHDGAWLRGLARLGLARLHVAGDSAPLAPMALEPARWDGVVSGTGIRAAPAELAAAYGCLANGGRCFPPTYRPGGARAGGHPAAGPQLRAALDGLFTGTAGTAAGGRYRGAAALTQAADARDYLYVGTLESPGSRYLVVVAAAGTRDVPRPAQLNAWLRQIARLAFPYDR